MPARFNVEGPSNAQWLEAEAGGTPVRQTSSPSALFRGIQEGILSWMQQQGVDQHYPYPSAAGRTGFVIHPSSSQAHATGAHPFAVDGILGTDSVTMIRAIAQAAGATAVASAALSALQNHRISPAVLAWGISLARQGKSITIETGAVMPQFGSLPTGAPRGGVILPGAADTSSTTPGPTFAPPGSTATTTPAPAPAPAPAPVPEPAPAPLATTTTETSQAAPGTTIQASFAPGQPAPSSWLGMVPTWAWVAGGAMVLVVGGAVVMAAMKKNEPPARPHPARRGASHDEAA